MVREDMKAEGNGGIGDEERCFQGKKDASFFAWPWDNLGIYKYLLYGPFLAKFLYSIKYEDTQKDWWCLHILIITVLRGYVYELWGSYSNMLFRNRNRRISQCGADFKQIDSEWDWDNFLILQAFVASMAYFSLPSLSNIPLWNTKGIICCLTLHMGLSEPIFYWTHRFMHSQHFFTHYHWLHHSSKVNHPFTGGHATFLEHIALCPIIMAPIIGTVLVGHGSISMIYIYILMFDFLRCLGHCNVEVIPYQIFQTLPFLRYFIYTPTYHSLHHTEMGTNFCLFMPLYDALGNTINKHSWDLQKEFSSGQGQNVKVPEFVFLAHVVDIMASMHVPFVFRSFSSLQYKVQPFLVPLWPNAFLVMLVMWARSKTMLISFYKLRGNLHETWSVPRFGFQYFLPFAKKGINDHIEEAILRADKLGVKVLGLAALNKNEALNGGGTLFIKKLPDLKVRVVHGNTLTAGVIIHQIPKDAEEVFLAGSTSKLGRAISIYLARHRVRVMMLTQSVERFRGIQKELPEECQKYLVQATSCKAAQHCKIWILGKWITPREQYWAPKGTHFYQFVVPPVIPFRRDCTYGTLVSMRLPDDFEELATCEYKLPRGVVHACHAGGIVHLLEGWTHHEVGAINVDEIDAVWNAAMKHGFRMV